MHSSAGSVTWTGPSDRDDWGFVTLRVTLIDNGCSRRAYSSTLPDHIKHFSILGLMIFMLEPQYLTLSLMPILGVCGNYGDRQDTICPTRSPTRLASISDSYSNFSSSARGSTHISLSQISSTHSYLRSKQWTLLRMPLSSHADL